MKNLFVFLSILFLFNISYSQDEIKISTKKITEHGIEFYLHTVKKGETLYRISKAYNVEINDILYFNPELFNGVKEGQIIKIPSIKEDENFYYHLVKKGETIFYLCKKYGITTDKLYANNPELKEKGLQEGKIIKIPKNKFSPNPKDFSENIENQDFIYHTVQPKETLYSISKKYNVSINEILDLNPYIKDQGLRKYETIKIPQKEKNKTKNQNKKQNRNVYLEHTVKKGETLYSISKSYGVTISDITKLNPEINEIGLREGQVIKIPEKNNEETNKLEERKVSKSDTIIPPQKVDSLLLAIDTLFSKNCDTTKFSFKEVTILLALPFSNINVQNDPKVDYTLVKNFKNYPPLEFYEGFLFALDSLKKKGIDIKLITRDINDTSEIKTIIADKHPSLIYLYGTQKQEMSLIRTATQYNIPVIDVFRNNLNTQYQNYFRLLATKYEKKQAVLSLISKLDTANIIFMYPSQDSSAIEFSNKIKQITENNPNQLLKTSNLNENEIKNIRDYLSISQKNYLILWSFDEPQVTKYINKLSILVGKHKINNLVLILLPEWKNYKLDFEQLHRLQALTIKQNYTAYDTSSFKNFAIKFKKYYENIPTKYSLWGFDVGFYFTSAYAYFGNDFYRCLKEFKIPLIETDFNITNDINKHNSNFYIIQYTQDFDEKVFMKL
jgi:LysM repeat protein